MTTIEYFYSHMSPWSYMGHQRLIAIAAEAGATVRFIPVSSGEVFAVSGGLPVNKRPEQRRAYRLVELERWRDHLGIPLNILPKFHPGPDGPAARLALAGEAAGMDIASLSLALMRACWVEERNIADRDTLIAIADEQGGDGAALIDAAEGDEIGAVLDANTAEAIEKKVFGYPWYRLNGVPYWGQDRLDFLERDLKAAG